MMSACVGYLKFSANSDPGHWFLSATASTCYLLTGSRRDRLSTHCQHQLTKRRVKTVRDHTSLSPLAGGGRGRGGIVRPLQFLTRVADVMPAMLKLLLSQDRDSTRDKLCILTIVLTS